MEFKSAKSFYTLAYILSSGYWLDYRNSKPSQSLEKKFVVWNPGFVAVVLVYKTNTGWGTQDADH